MFSLVTYRPGVFKAECSRTLFAGKNERDQSQTKSVKKKHTDPRFQSPEHPLLNTEVCLSNSFTLLTLHVLLLSVIISYHYSLITNCGCLILTTICLLWLFYTTKLKLHEWQNSCRVTQVPLPRADTVPALTWSDSSSSLNCKQWRRTDKDNRARKCATIAHVKEKE